MFVFRKRSLLFVAVLCISVLVAACGGGNKGKSTDPSSAKPLDIQVTADLQAVYAGGEVKLTAEVSGEGASGAGVAWTVVPDAGILSTNRGRALTWTAPDTPGLYTIKATATVGRTSAEDEVTINVAEPTGPLSIQVLADVDSIIPTDTVELTAVVGGTDSLEASIQWDATVGTLSSLQGKQVTWTAPAVPSGQQKPKISATARTADEETSSFVEIEVRLCTTGTVDTLCTISNVNQLQAMKDHLDGNFALDSHVDASNTRFPGGANDGFAPIGTRDKPFTGSFDGRGHNILKLYINRPASSGVGLFGQAGPEAEIKNVQLVEAEVHGRTKVGALIGYNKGTVTNAHSTGTVAGTQIEDFTAVGGLIGANEGGTITNSSSTASARGREFVGGLVGSNWRGTIANSSSDSFVESYDGAAGGLVGISDEATTTNSFSTGEVTGASRFAGGLVGVNNNATIRLSYSTATVRGSREVGGLVGQNFEGGTIETSYSSGSVTGTEESVGGLVGFNGSGGTITNSYSMSNVDGTGADGVGGLVGINDETSSTVRDSFSVGAVTGASSVGGLVGHNSGTIVASFWDTETSAVAYGDGEGKNTSEMKQQSTFTGWSFEGSLPVWKIDEGVDYPDLVDNPR